MSRYLPDGDPTALLDAVSFWRDHCLISDGSLFSKEALWTAGNLGALYETMTQELSPGRETAVDVVRDQVTNAPPEAACLLAEVLWVRSLFPRNIEAPTKRALVREFWEIGGTPLPEAHPYLRDDVIGGVRFIRERFTDDLVAEIAHLIRFVTLIKGLFVELREELFSDPWVFSNWRNANRLEGAFHLSHALSWMLFPDTFESIPSKRDKRDILLHFEGIRRRKLRRESSPKINRRLYRLRQRLEKNENRPIDFFESPWVDIWMRS